MSGDIFPEPTTWNGDPQDDPYDPARDAERGEREDECRCDSCGQVTEDPKEVFENRCPKCFEMFRHPADCEGCER